MCYTLDHKNWDNLYSFKLLNLWYFTIQQWKTNITHEGGFLISWNFQPFGLISKYSLGSWRKTRDMSRHGHCFINNQTRLSCQDASRRCTLKTHLFNNCEVRFPTGMFDCSHVDYPRFARRIATLSWLLGIRDWIWFIGSSKL